MVNLEASGVVKPQKPQSLPDGRMKNLRNARHGLDVGPDHPVLDAKERGQKPTADVTVLVDRHGQDRAPIGPEPLRVVGPPAE